MNSKIKKLIKNTAVVTFGKIATQMITFFLLPLYTAVLSTEEFGVVDLMTTLVSFLLPIITLQIEQGVFRFLIDARDKTKDKEKTNIISTVIFQLLIQSCLYILIFIIISCFISNEYKFFLLTNVLAGIFSSLFLQIARGLGDNVSYAVGCFITSLATIVFNLILLLVFKLGAYGMLISSLLGHIICCVYVFGKIKMYKYFKFKAFDLDLLKRIVKYSAPLVPNMVSWWIVNISDRLIITFVLGVALNGVYSVANKFPTILSTIYGVFNITWTESAAVNINEKDKDEFFNNIFKNVIAIIGALSVGMIAYMPLCFSLFVNENFNDAYYQIPILIMGNFFYNIGTFLGAIYVAQKKTKEIAKITLISAIINASINILAIKYIGLYAASVSTLIAYLFICVYRFIDLRRDINLKIPVKGSAILVGMSIITIITYYTKNIYLVIANVIITTLFSIIFNKDILLYCIKTLKNKIIKGKPNGYNL